MSNRLANETSPYLLQHAENPVDWYPWGEPALTRARTEGLPILLSIGYSACHWCHVMEHESFEDSQVAALMNQLFVNIKVDREERPDLDAVYMRAVQAMTGHGGWPLTVFLTPEGAPYYGGTYFPPEARSGMPAFRQVLRAASEAWKTRPEETQQTAERVREFIERSTIEAEKAAEGDSNDLVLSSSFLEQAYRGIASRYDPGHGGFGPSPKFPQPTSIEYLLRYHVRTGDPHALKMVTHTLDQMARGGIHDQVGGGFHRYSVDSKWIVPHFEKMLYDNALLSRVYLQAFQVTGDVSLRDVVRSTLDYILGDLRSSQGGFYTARDADTGGEEGRYYLWTPSEVEAALGWEESPLLEYVYDVTAQGNFEGRNILHVAHDLSVVAQERGMDLDELRERLSVARKRLRRARERRTVPRIDDKIVTSLNGLTIRSLVEAGGALDDSSYVEAARRAMRFVLHAMRPGAGLLHVFAGGRAQIPGFLDDYAALGNALVSLYETTLEPDWLSEAVWCVEWMIEEFYDRENGVFFDSPKSGESLLVRSRETADRATPSGNALAAELFVRCAILLDRPELRELAEEVVTREQHAMIKHPSGFGRLLSVTDLLLSSPVEIAIIGPRNDPRTHALRRAALARFIPNRVVAGREPNETLPLRVPLVADREWIGEQPSAYLCRNHSCLPPVTDPDALSAQLS